MRPAKDHQIVLMTTLLAGPSLVVSWPAFLRGADMRDLANHSPAVVDQKRAAILKGALISAVGKQLFDRFGLNLKPCVVVHS